MSRFAKIGKVAELLGFAIQTLRRWENQGIITSRREGPGATRYYDVDKLLGLQNPSRDLTIGYASSLLH